MQATPTAVVTCTGHLASFGRIGNLCGSFFNFNSDVNAIIFVVDSTDRIRMCVAKEELEEVLRNNEVSNDEEGSKQCE